MAQPNLKPFKVRAIASMIQSVLDTPGTIVPATHGWRLYNGQSGVTWNPVEDNPDTPYFFEGTDFVAANESAFVEGEARITPPSVPGDAVNGVPEIDVAMRTAGFARTLNALACSTTYTPINEDFEFATHQWEQSGLFKEIFNARTQIGDIVFEIGQRAKLTGVRVQGEMIDLDEDQLTGVVVSDAIGPVMRADNSSQIIRINGGTPIHLWAKLHGLQLNASVQTEEYTEHKETGFGTPNPNWRIRLARTAIADFNPVASIRAGDIVEVWTRLRNADGRYAELYTRGKIREYSEVDIDGKFGWELNGPTLTDSITGIGFSLGFSDETFRINGTLPDGEEGEVYSDGDGIAVSGKYTAPIVSYAITAGALPDGLSITAGTGAITGTPTTAGSYTFTITATDSTSGTALTASKEFTVEIAA